ncbi:MAG: hypothetical protein PG981_000068 [Wolbachia endosymbiont of Ctenocephalides orientis wCori]|nr:MAG: hypothetical protein PG981_000068 [Wolbachia endosymbiont of Ctenocephalides orientis wCori]
MVATKEVEKPESEAEQPQPDPTVKAPSPTLDDKQPQHEDKSAPPFTNGKKPQSIPPHTDPQKPESNSKYYKIGGAGVGLVIGLAIAYFVGAATVTPLLAAVAVFIGAALCGAVLGSAVGACLSCLLNPEVSNLSELSR